MPVLEIQAQTLTVSSASGILKACVNSPAATPHLQQFTLSGTDLTAPAMVAAPASFEVSLSPTTGFGSSVSVNPVAGTISNTIIYVRLTVQATAGIFTGDVTVTSSGATSKAVAVRGTIYSLPAMMPVSDKTFEHNVASAEIAFVSITGGNTYTWTNSNTDIGLPATGQGTIPSYVPVNVTPNPVSATITVTPISTGFAFVPWGDEVKVMNTQTLELVKTIPVGTAPLGVAVSPDGTKVFISNSESNTVSVIDVNTLEVAATIAVGAGPTELVVNADGTRVYVLSVIPRTVSVINTTSNTVIATIPISASNPSKLAFNPVMNRLYVVAGTSQITEVNTSTNAQVGTYTIGNAFTLITGIAVDPVLGYAYVSDGGFVQNKVYIFEINNGLSLKGTITTAAGPDGIVISPDGSRAYIAIGDNDVVAIADLNTRTIINSVAAGMGPEWLAISPDGNYVYAQSRFFSGTISVINTVTQQPAGELDVISTGRSGNFISPGSGCSGPPVTFTITVNPRLPQVTVSKPVGTIVGCEGAPSADPRLASMQVSGVSMRSGITLTAPSAFEVSTNKASGYAPSLVLPAAGTVVPETTIYIRSNATAPAGDVRGTLVITATDAAIQNVLVRAWIDATPEVEAVDDQFFQSGTETQTISFTGDATEFSWTNSNPGIGLEASGTGPIFSFLAIEGLETPMEATITVTPKSFPLAYLPFYESANSQVSVLDLTTRDMIWTYSAPDRVDNMAFSQDGKYVYTSSVFKINVINTHTRVNEQPIELSGMAGAMAVSPDGSRLYVATRNNKITVINTVTRSIVTVISVRSDARRLLMSRDGQKLYVAYDFSDSIDILSTSTHTVIGQIGVASASDMKLNSDETLMYVAHSAPSPAVSVVDLSTNLVTSTIPVTDVYHISITPDDHYLFLTRVSATGVVVVDAFTNTVVKTITTGDPSAVSISRDGLHAYVRNSVQQTLSVISIASLTVVETIPLGIYGMAQESFLVDGAGCTGPSKTFKITIGPPPPTMMVTRARGFIESCEGVASASPEIQKFYVSGIQLEGNVVVTAPAHVEVSLSPINNFAGSVSLTPVAEELDSIPVYVRASAVAPAGDLLEMLQLTSTGAGNEFVEVKGSIHAAPEAYNMSDLSFLSGEQTTPVSFLGGAQTYSWTNTTPGIGLPAGGVGTLPTFTASNPGSEPLTATISVQSKSAVYAYLPRNYPPHSLEVLNTETGEIVKTIPLAGDTWAGTIAQNDDYVYVNSKTILFIISKTTLSVVSSLDLGGGVTDMVMSKDGRKLYANVSSRGLIILDTDTNTIIQESNSCCGGDLSAFALDEENGFIYAVFFVANPTYMVIKFDLATLTLVKFQGIDRLDFNYPGVTFANGKLFIVNGHKLVTVMNSELQILSTIDTETYIDGLAMDVAPNGEYVYVANAFHHFYEINTETNKIDRSIAPEGFHGQIFNASRNLIYTLPYSNLGLLSVIDMTTGEVLRELEVDENARPNGNFVSRSTGCAGAPASFTITVYPEDYPLPEIIVSSATGSIVTCEDSQPQSPNHQQQFIVSAEDLSGNLSIAAPQGFEIGLSATGSFSQALQLVPTGGAIASTTVYVRISSVSPAAQRVGNVTLTADGANTKTVTVEGRILDLPDLAPATMAPATVGNWYNYFELMGMSGVTLTATGLPGGLTLSPEGAITGVPTTAVNNYQFQITADNGSCTKSAIFTITINKGTANVGISNTTTAYNGTAKSVTVTTSPEGLAATVTYNGSATLPVNAGTYAVQVAVNTPDYTGSASGSLTINPVQLNVTAGDKTRIYGENNPALTLTYSGFVNGETSAVLDQEPVAETVATAISDVGSYPITITGGTDTNYSMILNNGTLTITRASQTINFTDIEDHFTDDEPFPVFASASSTFPVTFSILSGPATISDNIITLTGIPGIVTVRVSQSGTININPASADRQFEVKLLTGEDPGYAQSVKLYPNPAVGKAVLSVPADLIHAQTELVNAQGVTVFSRNFAGHERMELMLDQLPRGLYIVRIKTEKALLTRKLVVR